VALVLKAQIGGHDVERVFMDAGSGINLIYIKTLRAMHISLDYATQRFWILKQSNKAKAIKNMILKLRHRDKT
jgi:hypothetical protein